jgi:hypothetical protein
VDPVPDPLLLLNTGRKPQEHVCLLSCKSVYISCYEKTAVSLTPGEETVHRCIGTGTLVVRRRYNMAKLMKRGGRVRRRRGETKSSG